MLRKIEIIESARLCLMSPMDELTSRCAMRIASRHNDFIFCLQTNFNDLLTLNEISILEDAAHLGTKLHDFFVYVQEHSHSRQKKKNREKCPRFKLKSSNCTNRRRDEKVDTH